MPVALISTNTSPNFGPCRSTVSIVRGWPAFQATAALVFMVFVFFEKLLNGTGYLRAGCDCLLPAASTGLSPQTPDRSSNQTSSACAIATGLIHATDIPEPDRVERPAPAEGIFRTSK